jgi:hypothetical protein
LCAALFLAFPALLAQTSYTNSWQSIGPAAVSTASYGLVTGRVTSLALDTSNSTTNTLYVGTTGGGVWSASYVKTATTPTLTFTPLIDSLSTLGLDTSFSIGALTVQPGGTGVVLAGTGDPNDALDSYYGMGILRSTDGGSTWTLKQSTANQQPWSFVGEGFAGFAWSGSTPQTVVAAVSQAREATLVNAVQASASYEGLYYSTDGGADWNLATIADGSQVVQGAVYPPSQLYDGNAATAVVWNPRRSLFIAAVRYHGYYQSTDGMNWTRLAAQPGANLTAGNCPTLSDLPGSEDCPIFRGALAVNPYTGDTFAWTTNFFNQDQGLWQDSCNWNGTACANTGITFATQLSTAKLETNTIYGAATIANGDYTLSLAAVPYALNAGADTILLAGADDLWKCSLATGCAWSNTTNAATCMSAKVAAYQHALLGSAVNSDEIFVGNDGGLWRSADQIGESGTSCDPTDATHFQNLNGGFASLTEPATLAQSSSNPYALMAGLGVNGTVGVNGATAPSGDWPQILTGQGGPVAIDAASNHWYVNNSAGVSIQQGSASAGAPPASFNAVLDYSTTPLPLVVEDGLSMTTPAPFLVDPLDDTQLLIGTCRVWRGPASGVGWTASNAVSAILDGGQNTSCSGDALIRSMAALPLANGTEVVVVGMYGAINGANLPGHVLSAVIDPSRSTAPVWTDLTANPVTNSSRAFNNGGLDIASLTLDAHDPTGNTVYGTVEGMNSQQLVVHNLYRSTDGGAHWISLQNSLPNAPLSALAVDPQNRKTVYVATDVGVYATQQIDACAGATQCWTAYGAGLPMAPATALSVYWGSSEQLLTAATYGRGLWQIPLLTAGEVLSSASVTPASLAFPALAEGNTSSAQTVTVTNAGSIALALTDLTTTPSDFAVASGGSCTSSTVLQPGASCTVAITFSPTVASARSGALLIDCNVPGGDLQVALSGTGTAAAAVLATPVSYDFGAVAVNALSSIEPFTLQNTGTATISSVAATITAPFKIYSNACGATLAGGASCQVLVEFAPTTGGTAAGALIFTDSAGTQSVALYGTGQAAATDTLSPTSLSFAATLVGQTSAAQTVSLTNSGGLTLQSINISVSGPFQQTNTCGTALAGGASCSISVLYAPTAAGGQTGALTVADAMQTQTVALTGTGLSPPVIGVSPAVLNFGAQSVGTTSAAQTLTVSNTGGTAMGTLSFTLGGAAASSFILGATTCSATLNPGSSCIIPVSFAPQSAGGAVASLAISSATAGVAAISLPLTGNGGAIPASLTVLPTVLTFGTVGVGASSSSQSVTVSNPGTAASVTGLSFAPSTGFTLASASTTCQSTLAAQGTCTVSVVFAPTTTGAQAGTLTISGSGVSAVTVTLTGTGFSFTVAAVGSSSQTVANGQTADYTLAITPQGGGQGSFSFSCGSLPDHAVCVFNPGNETLSGAGNEIVEIETGVASAELPPRRIFSWTGLPLLCGFLPLAWRLRRVRRRLLMGALLVLLVGGLSHCSSSGGGSGGGASGGSGSTPAGTYAVPVTVSANGVMQNITLTLIVD